MPIGDRFAFIGMRLIDALAEVLRSHYQKKVDQSKRILSKEKRNASGRLSASLRPVDRVINENTAEIEVIAEEHWKFIDKGVKGWANEKAPFDSPFQFKKKFIPVSALSGAGGWVANKGLVKRGANAKAENLGLAKVFSASIPKKGIAATRFISDVFNEKQIKQLSKQIAKAQAEYTEKAVKNYGNND